MIKEVTLWYAVDEDGSQYLYTGKPIKDKDMWVCDNFSKCYDAEESPIPFEILPPLTWEDAPVEIKLTIEISTLIESKKK